MQKNIPNTHAPTKQAMKRQQMKNNKAHHEIIEQKKEETDAVKLDADEEESEVEDEDVDMDMDDSDMDVDEDDEADDDDDDDVPLPLDSEDEAELEAQRIRFNDLLAAKAASSQLSSLSESSTTNLNSFSTKTKIKTETELQINKPTTDVIQPKLTVNEKSLKKCKINQQKPLTTQNLIFENCKKETPAPTIESLATNVLQAITQSLPPPPPAKKRRGRPPLQKRKRTHSPGIGVAPPQIPTVNLELSPSQSSTSSSGIVVAPPPIPNVNLELCAGVYVQQHCYAFACMLCNKNFGEFCGLTGHLKVTHKIFEETPKKKGRKKTLPTPPNEVIVKHEPITLDRVKLFSFAKIYALNRQTLTLTCTKCDVEFKDEGEFPQLDQHLRDEHNIFNEEAKLIKQIKIEMPDFVKDYASYSKLVMVSIPSDASDMLSSEDSLPETPTEAMEVIDSDKEKQQPTIIAQNDQEQSKYAQKYEEPSISTHKDQPSTFAQKDEEPSNSTQPSAKRAQKDEEPSISTQPYAKRAKKDEEPSISTQKYKEPSISTQKDEEPSILSHKEPSIKASIDQQPSTSTQKDGQPSISAQIDQPPKIEEEIVVNEEVVKETDTNIPKASSDVTKEKMAIQTNEGASTSSLSSSASIQKTEEVKTTKRKPRGRPKKDKLSKPEPTSAVASASAGTTPMSNESTDIITPRKRGRKPKTVDTNNIDTTLEALLSNESQNKSSTSQEIKEETPEEDAGNDKKDSVTLMKSPLLSSSTETQVQKSINESTSDTTKTPQRPMRKSKAQVVDYGVDVKDEDEDDELKEPDAAPTSSEYSPSSNSTDSSMKEIGGKCEKSDDEFVLNEATEMVLISKGTSSDGKTVYTCNICTKSLNKMSRMLDHQRLHTGEKPYACSVCDKSFRLRVRMKEHILRHRTEKAYKCDICDLPIATKQDLTLHMRHHQADRRHKCNVCDKGFVRSSDLTIHVRIHTGEKPFNCDICGKAFRARQNLVVHRRSHVGDKPVKCEVCEKRFSRKIDLRVHMRKHTGEKPYICEVCNRGYSSRFNLQCHIDREHLKGVPKKKPGRKSRSMKDTITEQKKLIKELTKRLASKDTSDLAEDESDVSIDNNDGDEDEVNDNNEEDVGSKSTNLNKSNTNNDHHNDNDDDCIANDGSNNIMQQVSVTVSMQVEQVNGDSSGGKVMIVDNVNVRNNDDDDNHHLAVQPEKENDSTLVSSLVVGSPTALNDKTKASNRKITSYFTVVGQQAEI